MIYSLATWILVAWRNGIAFIWSTKLLYDRPN